MTDYTEDILRNTRHNIQLNNCSAAGTLELEIAHFHRRQ